MNQEPICGRPPTQAPERATEGLSQASQVPEVDPELGKPTEAVVRKGWGRSCCDAGRWLGGRAGESEQSMGRAGRAFLRETHLRACSYF